MTRDIWKVKTLCPVFFLMLTAAPLFGQSSPTVPRSGGQSWEQRFARQLDAARSIGNVDILLLGATPFTEWERTAPESWKATFGRRKVVNFAQAGELTQSLLWKITLGKGLEGISPSTVILSVGENNVNTPVETSEGIRIILAEIRKQLPDARVLILPVTPRGREGSPIWENVEDLNAGMARLADERNLMFVDISSRLKGDEAGRLSGAFERNRFQLTPLGYWVISEAIRPFLPAGRN